MVKRQYLCSGIIKKQKFPPYHTTLPLRGELEGGFNYYYHHGNSKITS